MAKAVKSVTSTPKICIFTETYYPVVGGGETQARALAEGLVTSGFEIIILTRRSHHSFTAIEQFGRVTVYRIAPVGSEHYKKWGMLITCLPILIKQRRHYDLLFVSGFRVLGIAAVLISKIFRKTCILKADSRGEMSGDFFTAGLATLHLHSSSLAVKLFLSIRNKILRSATSFVAISSDIATELITNGVKPSIIHYLPNSVDTETFFPVSIDEKRVLRHKLAILKKEIIITFTGRLVSYKGLPLLMNVWKEIQRKHTYAGLLLVGSGGLDIHNCEAQLKEYVGSNELQESIYFTGEVNNVHEYLQASDIFVFPTESEAFGISLIEAMACGLPVISTAVGGVKDIIVHKHNGLVSEAGNFEQLYDALDTLISDTSLWAPLGQAARQTVQDRYSQEVVIKKYSELFMATYTKHTEAEQKATAGNR